MKHPRIRKKILARQGLSHRAFLMLVVKLINNYSELSHLKISEDEKVQLYFSLLKLLGVALIRGHR